MSVWRTAMSQESVNRLCLIIAESEFDGDFENARFELCLRFEQRARHAKSQHLASAEMWDQLGLYALSATKPNGAQPLKEGR